MRVSALGYVGIESTKPEEWARFGPDILGLQASSRSAGPPILFRMDERAYRLAVHPAAQDKLSYIGLELPSLAHLRDAFEELRAAGYAPEWASAEDCQSRLVRALARCKDPVGTQLELFEGPLVPRDPFRPARPITGFVTGRLGLGHVVLVVPDLEQVARFYIDVLGFRVTDSFRDIMVFLRCNARHHSIALAQLEGPLRLHHILLEVRTIQDVGITYDLCRTRGVPLGLTLGQHANDFMISFYLKTPSGFEIEYGCNGLLINEEAWGVTQIDVPDIWGHEAVGERIPIRNVATADRPRPGITVF